MRISDKLQLSGGYTVYYPGTYHGQHPDMARGRYIYIFFVYINTYMQIYT